jgi:succinate-acetate transporter protein
LPRIRYNELKLIFKEDKNMENNEKNNVPGADNQPSPPAAAPKGWSNPTPAGLVALAVACFGFCALLGGHVNAGALPLLGSFLLGGFVVQIIVAMLDLKGGNTAGGNTFLYFSAFFMLSSGIEMFVKYKYGAAIDTRLDGWVWVALTLVVALWTPAFYKTPAILFLIVIVLNLACPSVALADLGIFNAAGTKVLKCIAGYSLLTCGILAIYLSAAMVVNATYGKTVFPNPAPFYKEKKCEK